MVIAFHKSLNNALIEIGFQEGRDFYRQYEIYPFQDVINPNSSERFEKSKEYRQKRDELLREINQGLAHKFQRRFDMSHWFTGENDDLANFLAEAGSNAFTYSEYHAPHQLGLWLSDISFVVSVEQLGKGFNANKINNTRQKSNAGAGFELYRNCASEIFFDNPEVSKKVYMQFRNS